MSAPAVARALAAAALMSITALALLPVGVLTLFRARRLYSAVARVLSRSILRLYGIRVRLAQRRPFPE